MRTLVSIQLTFIILIVAYAAPVEAQDKAITNLVARCAALKSIDFADVPDAPTRVLVAKLVGAVGDMPEYCDVQGYVSPQVGFELLLPSAQWNDKRTVRWLRQRLRRDLDVCV
jgi:hypothetical protein